MDIAIVLISLAILLLIGILLFEILMFLDVIKNKKLSDTEKIIWAFGMLLFHPVVAIVYYFAAHSRLRS